MLEHHLHMHNYQNTASTHPIVSSLAKSLASVHQMQTCNNVTNATFYTRADSTICGCELTMTMINKWPNDSIPKYLELATWALRVYQ